MGTSHAGHQRIAVLDVDGTLVDTNYQHALAWHRAFRSLGRRSRSIGSTGSSGWAATSSSALCGDEVEKRIGDDARERWVRESTR